MTTYEAIKQMTFGEMVRFLDAIEPDDYSGTTCSENTCPFGIMCKKYGTNDDPICAYLGTEFSVAKFLLLDYEKTKIE